MELTTLYVIKLMNGEKHFFSKEIDRKYYFNRMSTYNQVTCSRYEISLENF